MFFISLKFKQKKYTKHRICNTKYTLIILFLPYFNSNFYQDLLGTAAFKVVKNLVNFNSELLKSDYRCIQYSTFRFFALK